MNATIIETKRLFLRELTISDAENMYHLNLDPEVLQFTGDEPFQDVQSAKTFLEKYNHYSKYGFGRWAVINKENIDFLGWCGLKYSPELDEFDIGFRFFKKHWNKGYATEAAEACLKLGFEKFKMQKILGRAMLKNIGSIKVLEKIGLKYLKPFNFNDEQGVIYQIEKIS